jgi:anti-anti-sigma factor
VTPDETVATATSGARVAVGRYSGTAVLHIQGDLDARTAPAWRAELADAAGEVTVLFDLTGVRVIDSVGLGALLGAIRTIHEHGGRVAAVAGPAATALLRDAGVDRLVFLADSPVAGLGWLHQPESYLPPGSATGADDRM